MGSGPIDNLIYKLYRRRPIHQSMLLRFDGYCPEIWSSDIFYYCYGQFELAGDQTRTLIKRNGIGQV